MAPSYLKSICQFRTSDDLLTSPTPLMPVEEKKMRGPCKARVLAFFYLDQPVHSFALISIRRASIRRRRQWMLSEHVVTS
jgi:hypothetical protein